MNKNLTWKIALAALLVWLLRVGVILPFLDENGGFTFTEGNTLPPIVDYFFSALFFAMIVLMGWVSYFFIPKYPMGEYAKGGWQVFIVFVLVFLALDIVVEIGMLKRTVLGYIQTVFIDYSPLFIPVISGYTAQKISK